MTKFIEKDQINERELEICRKLYGEGFPEDADDYVDYFFKERDYKAALGENEDSVLYLVNKYANFHGKLIGLNYIVSFSALKSARGTGSAGRLMRDVLRHERDNGVPFVVLSPFNHTYYRQYGFRTVDTVPAFAGRVRYRAEPADPQHMAMAIYKVRSKLAKGCDICQYSNINELIVHVKEETAGGAEPYVLYYGGELYGYEFVMNDISYERYTVNMQETDTEGVQARITSPMTVMRLIKYTSQYRGIIKVEDSILGDSRYRIDVGPQHAIIEELTDLNAKAVQETLGIEDLTRLAFKGPKENEKGFASVFPVVKTRFFDKY